MKKFIITLILFSIYACGVDIGMTQIPTTDTNITVTQSKKVFGYNLFMGKFSNIKQYRFDPNYRINIGDNIKIMFWGAYNSEFKVVVDNQGNIFIPQVGIINIVGIKASELNQKIQKAVQKVFKKNVAVYANILNYQPVSIFVSGSVNNPGLYEGLSSDSIIQFLDKAKGINLENGSFRNIYIKRNGKILKKIDLYNFLLGGNLNLFQFRNGDVIFVDNIHYYVYVKGDVKRGYRFELKQNKTTLQNIIKEAIPNKTATNIIVYHWHNNKITTTKLSLNDTNYIIYSGDEIEFLSDNNANQITIHLEGEISGTHTLVLQKGTSLQQVLNIINYSKLANKKALQLYRKSIANLQKQMIESQLKDLEARVLSASSVTTSGATIRKEEAQMILQFIQRAKQVQPKGRVVLNKETNLSNVILENEDVIFIPKKSSIITIQGEVKIPGAQTYVKSYSIDDYINSVGGFTERADTKHLLIIKQNGKILTYNMDEFFRKNVIILPGDSILVLSKPNSENLQITKDITQILYQIAVSAGVVLRLF